MAPNSLFAGSAVFALATVGLLHPSFVAGTVVPRQGLLDSIIIPNADNVLGYLTLPTEVPGLPGVQVQWTSSHPEVVSDKANGTIAAGVVNRPAIGSSPVTVTLTACVTIGHCQQNCRQISVTVQPSVKVAQFSRYAMANFARSNSQPGQQVYMATSLGNEATTWVATNAGDAVLVSSKGMHGTRDPFVVRSPEGDRFYLIATDLNVDATEYGWQGWDWAQSGASRYIEVWESYDLRNWSEQRHVLVAPEEAGMTFAPESIWDPQIGAYVVYWTSSMYPAGTSYSSDRNATNGRYPLTRGQSIYTTTRDFITFTPAKVMSGRPGHGTLDPSIVQDEGFYHRFVSDRISTGVNLTTYARCESEDIYQERARSILAPENEWELVESCITHDTMNTTYAEGPMIIRSNPGDPRGKGYYLYADQRWDGSPSGLPMEQQYHPYWTEDIAKPKWKPIDWTQKPDYKLSQGVIRHGSIWAVTTAEHAALRGADLVAIEVTSPNKSIYRVGEPLDLAGMVVSALYSDGIQDDELFEGHGGYSVTGFNAFVVGIQLVEVTYTVVDTTRTASFEVDVQDG
ncbi:hypothetical protein S7711_08471 [Stachybotrys chartarum IBT 7711]|uniref:Uncharacterized protein n=1 Tax=Stachybotrys chartarum (strain CBS 109288 / IBT 7711) TaxID=1280523 RepID=A0A084AGI4_STACB|nr:hypothetical protein S7711_08471 [Stachybotrys chartarum IBT 7711]KFA52701.1 hypothetical protein S40293_08755 [Stachybotrys chartarum IBT 40293]KFA71781.1 hypothetical protein S40288_07444 [Stachybotrys chartarum IBT 40288]